MSAALAFAGAQGGLELLSGLFGYLQSGPMGDMAESRGRVLRMEAEAEAERYAEEGAKFKASQAVSYLKSGVELSGSPLDVLTETALTIQENISAIRAGGRAAEFDAHIEAEQIRMGGRAALLKGITGGLMAGAQGVSGVAQSRRAAKPRGGYPTATPSSAYYGTAI